MKAKTKLEIAAEIRALKAFATGSTNARVNFVIAILEGRKVYPATAAERELAAEVWRWKENVDAKALPPSSGWQALVRH